MQYLTCGQLCERSVYSILISPLDLLVAFIAESLDGDRDNSFMSSLLRFGGVLVRKGVYVLMCLGGRTAPFVVFPRWLIIIKRESSTRRVREGTFLRDSF
jgi:hypothetical protein